MTNAGEQDYRAQDQDQELENLIETKTDHYNICKYLLAV